jgi:hypothetical protein
LPFLQDPQDLHCDLAQNRVIINRLNTE